MRFTKETTKELRSWLKDNGFEVGCRLDKEWEYEPNDNFIGVLTKYDESCDFDFMLWLRDNGLKSDFDCVTLSFLHELGHYNTIDNFTDNEWLSDAVLKQALTFSATDRSELLRDYWNTETEKQANLWAIWFADNHPKETQKLEDIFSCVCECLFE